MVMLLAVMVVAQVSPVQMARTTITREAAGVVAAQRVGMAAGTVVAVVAVAAVMVAQVARQVLLAVMASLAA